MLIYNLDLDLNPPSNLMIFQSSYEIQLKPESRRKGLGKVLMETLERIGESWGMKKVMLTVQLGTTKSLSHVPQRHLSFLYLTSPYAHLLPAHYWYRKRQSAELLPVLKVRLPPKPLSPSRVPQLIPPRLYYLFPSPVSFLPDEISPSQTGAEEEGGEPAAADYEILSKPLPQHTRGSAS